MDGAPSEAPPTIHFTWHSVRSILAQDSQRQTESRFGLRCFAHDDTFQRLTIRKLVDRVGLGVVLEQRCVPVRGCQQKRSIPGAPAGSRGLGRGVHFRA